MPIEPNATHDPARRSWVPTANDPDGDFPIQNLPFGLFRHDGRVRGGVALGDRIVDLAALAETGLLGGGALTACRAGAGETLAPLLAATPSALSALRTSLSDLFRDGGDGDCAALSALLVPMQDAELLLPLRPTAFTDFCTSYDHIARMGQSKPNRASLSLPVAYNGRASSVRASGAPVVRPNGQFETPPGSGNVRFGPEPMLDFELEFGAWLRAGNAIGQPIDLDTAEDLLFGCCLVNDWSARGIQFFESILGPHLGKSFLTTISPWIVTMEALAPFRTSARGRASDEPAILPHLLGDFDRARGAIDVVLTADLLAASGGTARLTETNLADLLWTLAQMATHQASNGAPLEAGDLIATGTVSGASDSARGCLAEITLRGGAPVTLSDGSTRSMIEDGDVVTLRGRAQADGFVPIGFGACTGTVQPAPVWPRPTDRL